MTELSLFAREVFARASLQMLRVEGRLKGVRVEGPTLRTWVTQAGRNSEIEVDFWRDNALLESISMLVEVEGAALGSLNELASFFDNELDAVVEAL